ncbi:hypothetical protein LTR56_004458 [Elasticomyces elasticus]|nr:hypothetical protein LTR22_016874 [Elasticomyces elasticus]KAK3653604.1 hypothetical protein LTR56_004458 [Elasticomyces elasticus]KAK4916495.1 hypothetical protein LTR49_015463 [Elasticomyces elasticus]KAK5755751.1 hypothetical protein LTS12_014104 [Elasticomyces elasticus]
MALVCSSSGVSKQRDAFKLTEPFRSARLIYRAAEPEELEDQKFFTKVQQEPLSYQNANVRLSKPQSSKSGKDYLKFVAEEALIGVIICLPASEEGASHTPIGIIHLDKLAPHITHHRFAEIGLEIVTAYQGQGYGSEAIRWVLQFAFLTAGLHRVEIRAVGYNPGAVRLYERLGFKREGLIRERLWFGGKWWDEIQLGMLDSDWKAWQGKDPE